MAVRGRPARWRARAAGRPAAPPGPSGSPGIPGAVCSASAPVATARRHRVPAHRASRAPRRNAARAPCPRRSPASPATVRRIRCAGKWRCQPSSVSRSPFLTSAIAQWPIRASASSVAPAASACLTASVHCSWRAYHRHARRCRSATSSAILRVEPLAQVVAHQMVIAEPAPFEVHRFQQQLARGDRLQHALAVARCP